MDLLDLGDDLPDRVRRDIRIYRRADEERARTPPEAPAGTDPVGEAVPFPEVEVQTRSEGAAEHRVPDDQRGQVIDRPRCSDVADPNLGLHGTGPVDDERATIFVGGDARRRLGHARSTPPPVEDAFGETRDLVGIHVSGDDERTANGPIPSLHKSDHGIPTRLRYGLGIPQRRARIGLGRRVERSSRMHSGQPGGSHLTLMDPGELTASDAFHLGLRERRSAHHRSEQLQRTRKSICQTREGYRRRIPTGGDV